MDRLIGMLVLLGMAVVFCLVKWDFLTSDPRLEAIPVKLFGYHFHLTPAIAVYLVFLIALAAVVVIGLSLWLPAIKKWAKHFGIWEKLPLHGTFERIFDAYQRYQTAYGAITMAVLISVGNHTLNFLIAWLVLLAMGLEAPFWSFIAILPVIFLLIAIPISVSGFGIREGLCILFFSLFGFSQEHAIAFSLTIWAVLTCWSVVGGLFYLHYETPPDHDRQPETA